jgi:hypothetical protein
MHASGYAASNTSDRRKRRSAKRRTGNNVSCKTEHDAKLKTARDNKQLTNMRSLSPSLLVP